MLMLSVFVCFMQRCISQWDVSTGKMSTPPYNVSKLQCMYLMCGSSLCTVFVLIKKITQNNVQFLWYVGVLRYAQIVETCYQFCVGIRFHLIFVAGRVTEAHTVED